LRPSVGALFSIKTTSVRNRDAVQTHLLASKAVEGYDARFMTLKLRLLPIPLVLVLAIVVWLGWNWPRRVDMSQYAPSDSIVYLECNDLPAVANAIVGSNAWKHFAGSFGLQADQPSHRWLNVAASFGIGPAKSVLLARSQVAVVMLNLNAAEENATLNIKPEGAIVIETHTSTWRLRPAAEEVLQQFAQRLYGPVSAKHSVDGADFLEWTNGSDRRIVAAIDGSVLVVGNSKAAVQRCLDARHRPELSLRGDAALGRMRAIVGGSDALTFGYVSAENATKLAAWGTPLLFGREPGNSTLEQIVNRNAPKVLGAIGWSSRPTSGIIEDRFFISLEPSIVTRLRPAFRTTTPKASIWTVVPDAIDTISVYRSQTPSQAWDALRGISSQFDAVSAVLLNSLMKAALLTYGISDPDRFLAAVGPDMATFKANQSDNAVLIARVLDRPTLEQMFKSQQAKTNGDTIDFLLRETTTDKQFSATFVGDYLLVGNRDDVRQCVEAQKQARTIAEHNRPKIDLNAFSNSAAISTYTNDVERVRTFFRVLSGVRGGAIENAQAFADIPFANTETTLDDKGLDRRTKSALGQFSSLVALFKSD